MRNTIPLWLDLFIVLAAFAIVAARAMLMRSASARWFTVLVACFAVADLIKMGVVNDALVSLTDARAVRVAAQIFTIAAALVAAAAVRDARTAWAGRSVPRTRRIILRAFAVWLATSAVLIVLDAAAGDRELPIEAASPGWSIAYFVVYAGAIVLGDGYALAHVILALRSHDRNERPPAAIVATGIGIFVTTGLNSLSLLWYAVAHAMGTIGTAERLQRDSNGNVFAYFTLGMTAIALVGLVNWSARQRPADSDLASALRGLPILWQQLVERVPSVRLDPSVPLDRDEATVRMITECIDALVSLHGRGDDLGQNDVATTPAEVLRLARQVDPMTDRRPDVPAREVSGFPARS